MSCCGAWIQNLRQVDLGERVEIWDEDRLLYAGTVDQVDPAHDVVWVLEDGIGQRRMTHAQQHRLRCCSTGRPRCPAHGPEAGPGGAENKGHARHQKKYSPNGEHRANSR